MREADGRAVLRQLFTERGFAIEEDVLLEEDGMHVTLDGWDRGRRVGYEYITREAGDLDEFTALTMAKLEDRMHAGDLYVFLADETHEVDRKTLEEAALEFLDELRVRGVGR